jgi:nitrile hydratase
MNGAHDLGGMHGFGPVAPEPDEPVFHHEWERRAFAINLAAGALGRWNIDMGRYAREQMPAADYFATTYYEHWAFGLERLLVEHGLLQRGEVDGAVAGQPRAAVPAQAAGGPAPLPVLRAAAVEAALRKGGSARVDAPAPPRFKPGDAVRARNLHPAGHTRLPRYARGKRGVVERDHGVFVFPDTNGMALGKTPQHVYAVRFAASELWGPSAPARDVVLVDLWDDHLEPA